MLGHGGSSAGSYLADPTSPIPSHCAVHYPVSKCCSASIAVTGTVRINCAACLKSISLDSLRNPVSLQLTLFFALNQECNLTWHVDFLSYACGLNNIGYATQAAYVEVETQRRFLMC